MSQPEAQLTESLSVNSIKSFLESQSVIINQIIFNLKNKKSEIVSRQDEDMFKLKEVVRDLRNKMREYRSQGQTEAYNDYNSTLREICKNVLDLLESKSKSSVDAQIIYLSLKGDYFRYLIELNEDNKEEKIKLFHETREIYNTVIVKLASTSIMNKNKSAAILNYTVFLADELFEVDEAIQMSTVSITELKDCLETNSQISLEDIEYAKSIQALFESNLAYYIENRLTYFEYKDSLYR